jgi:hypothetical protein
VVAAAIRQFRKTGLQPRDAVLRIEVSKPARVHELAVSTLEQWLAWPSWEDFGASDDEKSRKGDFKPVKR